MSVTASEKDINQDVPEKEDPPAPVSTELDLAIEEFYNEDSDLSLGEKMSNLRNAYMRTALQAMKRINRFGTKSPISAEEQYKQEEGMKQFKLFERMFESELKANKLQGKPSEDMDKHWLKEIRKSRSSLGNIVAMIPKDTILGKAKQ